MRVDFYQLSRDPAESVVPLLAQNTLKAGARMLIVSADDTQLARVSEALWRRERSFLAHGLAGSPHEARQPILLSDSPEAANGAKYVALADGLWRDEALAFERAFLLFDDNTLEAARATWRALDVRDGVGRNFWKQEGGRWTKAA
jgi:DNA polymerase III subunit chi